MKDSTVTLEFFERGDFTEVVLTHEGITHEGITHEGITHEGITHEGEREGHTHGWASIMNKLEARYSANAS